MTVDGADLPSSSRTDPARRTTPAPVTALFLALLPVTWVAFDLLALELRTVRRKRLRHGVTPVRNALELGSGRRRLCGATQSGRTGLGMVGHPASPRLFDPAYEACAQFASSPCCVLCSRGGISGLRRSHPGPARPTLTSVASATKAAKSPPTACLRRTPAGHLYVDSARTRARARVARKRPE